MVASTSPSENARRAASSASASASPASPAPAVATPDPGLEPGTMVGEYRVDRKLGAGTFGDVYAGEQPLIGKRVAIKVLNRRFASDPVIVSRFVAEARAVNRIRQRNIIDIFSFGVVPGLDRHYFVMELLDGMTLGELLDRTGRLPVANALPLIEGIAAGLDAAHEAGITHRDLKPDNVFLARERDGSYLPKLLDFGIAKLAGQEVAHKTSSGMVLGTPRYMSPEQARGKATDHRADLYALGVMIHEVLTGSVLFDADSAVDLLLKHAALDPPTMSAVCSAVPPGLDAPVLAMLEKRPEDRPASAGAAVRELVSRARELGVAVTTRSLDDVIATPPSDRREPRNFSGTTAVLSDPVDTASELAARTLATDEGTSSPAEAREASRAITSAPRDRQAIGRSLAAASTQISGGVASTGPTSESLASDSAPGRAAGRGKTRALAIGAAVLVVGAIGLGAVFNAISAHAPPSSASPVAPSPEGSTETVSLALTTTPRDLEVWSGERRLGSSSTPLKLPRGAAPVQLRLHKQGFVDAVTTVTPDHDQTIDAELAPVVTASDDTPRVAPAMSAASLQASASPQASARVVTTTQSTPATQAGQGGTTKPVPTTSAGKLDRILGGRD